MNTKLAALLRNPHTTYAGIAVVACQIAAIWFPAYSAQLDKTSTLLLAYAVLLAGDAKPINRTKHEDEKPTSV